MMNPEVKQMWLEALRSGKYQQGRSCLRNENDQFCCLGVLCEIYLNTHPDPDSKIDWKMNQVGEYELDNKTELPPSSVWEEWAKLNAPNPSVNTHTERGLEAIAVLNDDGYSFNEIADLIEAQL